MKLIDIETGEEYCSNEIPEQFNKYCAPYIWCQKTGKVYEKREMFGSMDFSVGKMPQPGDTHKFLCFGEPLEKVAEMPDLQPGDYVTFEDKTSLYIFESGENVVFNKPIRFLWRDGFLLWERKS